MPNEDQVDADGNGQGDICQDFYLDRDGDGIADFEDTCEGPNPPIAGTDNPVEICHLGQRDRDGDGIVDDDNCPLVCNPDQRLDDPCMNDRQRWHQHQR